jgi:signal transduction histidine kinase
MKRTLNSLMGRLALLQLLIYAVLLPVLFFRLDAMLRASAISTFTQHARAYAGTVAKELELGDVLESASRTIMVLDGSVESAACVYAAVEVDGRLIGSSVAETPAWVQSRGDDVGFFKSADGTYAVAVPIRRSDKGGALYLGFDKRPTLEQTKTARRHIIEALLAYGIASIFAAVLLARWVSAPLTQLRLSSRRVWSGDSTAHLGTTSRMVEIHDLARDLELMRSELVGSAEKLRAEMRQRQIEQAERVVLESQLRHEQRLATIGTFSAGIAHEFNNILVPLILFTEDSLDEVGSQQPVRANLERVLRAAARAGNVVSKLLAFSRPVGERPPVPIDLAAVTTEALDLSQALLPSNVELVRQIDAWGEHALGDATLLNQVVLNLCTNAVHAMRESGGTLTVTVIARELPLAERSENITTRVLQLRVKDTGHGMNAATRERIFEPFFTTREVGQGSGFGLSIVHGIVTSMGGTISVISAVGAGSEFTIELPALMGAAAAPHHSHA